MHRDATAILKTLGQEVAQLVNGEQEAGYHEVKLDGSGLSSGPGECMQTRKLLLVKRSVYLH